MVHVLTPLKEEVSCPMFPVGCVILASPKVSDHPTKAHRASPHVFLPALCSRGVIFDISQVYNEGGRSAMGSSVPGHERPIAIYRSRRSGHAPGP